MPPDGSALDATAAYDLLGDCRRRAALVAVDEADGPLSLDRLAALVAAAEHGTPPASLTAGQRRAVSTDLRSNHLPLLCAAGALEQGPDGYLPGEHLDALLAVDDAVAARLGGARADD